MARADVLVEALKIMRAAIIRHIHGYSGLEADKTSTINDLEKKLKGSQSRAMIYRNIKDLRHKGILEDDGRELKITQAGKIAMM